MADKVIIGYAGGSWDVLNVGHLNLLEKAKSCCDFLIVGVSIDSLIFKYKGAKPVIPYKDRLRIIKSLKCVDKAIRQVKVFDINKIKKLGVNKFFLGDDWRGKEYKVAGLKWLKDNKILVYFKYTKGCSSTMIKENIIKDSYNIIKAQIRRKNDK